MGEKSSGAAIRAAARSDLGAASVEHAALVLLAALVAIAVALVVGGGEGDRSLASSIAFKQRCAVRYPDPCWQDPLIDAYGREVAGAVRALAPAPEARTGPGGQPIVGVDYRRCRQASCAVPMAGAAGAHLTVSNRRTAAYTSIAEDGAGGARIDYWVYRPTIGWERTTRDVDAARIEALASTPLPDTADPMLIPLETLLGRDDADFRAGEEPPWRGRIESRWGW